ncbi:MAG: hypothetical protein GEV07_23590 [Streptosporangiales bacterium]|nr:hypothetical protein [Streptosporangiales bacterium]
MLIDCDRCEMRDIACGDCVVTTLLGSVPGAVDIDDGERAALGVLAESGLVPPLRLTVTDVVDDERRRAIG